MISCVALEWLYVRENLTEVHWADMPKVFNCCPPNAQLSFHHLDLAYPTIAFANPHSVPDVCHNTPISIPSTRAAATPINTPFLKPESVEFESTADAEDSDTSIVDEDVDCGTESGGSP